MKFRLTAAIVLLSLFLASCSLSEDITPPPGYQSPTAAPAGGTAAATATPVPALVAEPATVTSVTSPAIAGSTTQSADGTATLESTAVGTRSTTPSAITSGTPAPIVGSITGKLVNGSGTSLPLGQKVTLEGFDQDASGNYQKSMELAGQVSPDGTYRFDNVEFIINRAFLVITSWQGVEYPSDPVMVKDASTSYSAPVTIYDETGDITGLQLDQVHLSFVLSSQNILQVTEIFIVSNPGKQAVIVPSDGTTIPFIHVPANGTGAQFQLSQNSAQLMNATGGFALVPGADKQYGFIASFNMPYAGSLKFDQLLPLAASSLTVFVPQGMKLAGKDLASAGTQDVQGQTFMMYQGKDLAAGGTLSLALSGNPGTSTAGSGINKTWIWVGIGVVGILLIGLGVYLYLRDRARLSLEREERAAPLDSQVEEDALGDDSDNIIDAMIALDDQYKAGEIPRDAYEKRRLDLKERLREIL